MVFDNALMQLGGLYFQVSSNKIRDPRDAARLATLTATWLRRIAPEFLREDVGSTTAATAPDEVQ